MVPPVVAVVSPSGITGSFLAEQRPLIAHIPVTTNQVSFESVPDTMQYDPSAPDGSRDSSSNKSKIPNFPSIMSIQG
jgi:hypothetical protein